MSQRERVSETIEEMAEARTLSDDYRVMLPVSLQAEHDLCDSVIDVVVSQGDASVTVTDAEVDDQGRFTVPAKKCDIYGLEAGKPVDILVDRVVLR